MTAYRPHYASINTGISTIDNPVATMSAAHKRAHVLIRDGVAQASAIVFHNDHGDKYSIADIEQIMADNNVPFEPIA